MREDANRKTAPLAGESSPTCSARIRSGRTVPAGRPSRRTRTEPPAAASGRQGRVSRYSRRRASEDQGRGPAGVKAGRDRRSHGKAGSSLTKAGPTQQPGSQRSPAQADRTPQRPRTTSAYLTPPPQLRTTLQAQHNMPYSTALTPPICRRPAHPSRQLHDWFLTLIHFLIGRSRKGGPARSGGPPFLGKPRREAKETPEGGAAPLLRSKPKPIERNRWSETQGGKHPSAARARTAASLRSQVVRASPLLQSRA